MNLDIISPAASHHYEVAWVELNTPVGNMIIQPGHAPLVITLSPNKPLVYCLKNGKQEVFTPTRAVAEVTRTHITILVSE